MKVKVKTFARFRELFGSDLAIDLPEGTGITGLVSGICGNDPEKQDALCGKEGNILGHVIVAVNGVRLDRDDFPTFSLKEGDEVALYPPVSGG